MTPASVTAVIGAQNYNTTGAVVTVNQAADTVTFQFATGSKAPNVNNPPPLVVTINNVVNPPVGTYTYDVQYVDGNGAGGTITAASAPYTIASAPVAGSDGPYTTPEDTPFVLGVAPGLLANDTDVDGRRPAHCDAGGRLHERRADARHRTARSTYRSDRQLQRS